MKESVRILPVELMAKRGRYAIVCSWKLNTSRIFGGMYFFTKFLKKKGGQGVRAHLAGTAPTKNAIVIGH
eukprot:CAMPEP_0172542182 /NCGR_PEP_ID=MMETSP1067-20121228/12855_1 /TAXON_ID=265564 ORGANISM="Thalassiosira punctigera, Strain Tpunct2005C2" /NCGR_SAMPLE_ID=MMETSP1067 /ASSEMBLY_ACC=CAM_ASM_000444 /LENGTH=69 /DNA_ID=CAMNT_0013328367 /DNA_START=396 /DNA_END=605 /DNA_ORIENTATION=-